MANDLGKAYVQIVPSAEGISGSITNLLKGESQNAGRSAGKSIVNTIKNAVIAGGIGKALMVSINQGAELEQNLGGTAAVFGEYANKIQKSAEEAYRNMGLSASDYMATANKMGSLFQGSGLDQQKSLELTSQAMQRAADVASVMGISGEMAMESIAGAAKGNFTMMDNLGVAMNATTLQAYALEKGVNFSWNTASNAEKAELAMKMFMDRTSQYAGNFARETDETLSGSLQSMKSAFTNVLGNLALGKDIKPSLKALASSTVTFVAKNFTPAVLNVVKALPSGVITLVQELGNNIRSETQGLLSNLSSDTLAGGVTAISNMATGILSNMPAVITSMGSILTSVGEQIVLALPDVLEQGCALIQNLANGLIQNLPAIVISVASVIASFLSTIGSHLPEILQKGIEIILKLAAGLIAAIPDLILKIPEIINAIKDEFMKFNWLKLGGDIIAGIGRGISNGVKSVIDAAVGAARDIYNSVAGFFGVHSPSRKMMYIGRMNDEGLAKGTLDNISIVKSATKKVMEEIAKPFDTGFTIRTAAQLPALNRMVSPALSGRGFNQEVNIYSPESLSPSEVARQTRNATKQVALTLNLGGSL